jgi:hypothetical protein
VHLRFPDRRRLGALAAPCLATGVLAAGVLAALGPANPAAAGACASPAAQAVSQAISHQLPAPSSPSAPCGTSSPAVSPKAADDGGPITDVFSAVHATSATDVWAVGNGGTSAAQTTLTEHWDGSSWTIVPSPSPGTSDSLLAVTATSATDVWAVGQTNGDAGVEPLIEHWNGTAWTVTPTPSPATFDSYFLSAAELTTNNAWAVGITFLGNGGIASLIEHWNGSAWTVTPSP